MPSSHGHCLAPALNRRRMASNSVMDEHQATEQRLTELEIKASFMEDLVDRLNEVVVRQQQQIDLLIRQVSAWRQQTPEEPPATLRSLRDELPPHY